MPINSSANVSVIITTNRSRLLQQTFVGLVARVQLLDSLGQMAMPSVCHLGGDGGDGGNSRGSSPSVRIEGATVPLRHPHSSAHSHLTSCLCSAKSLNLER